MFWDLRIEEKMEEPAPAWLLYLGLSVILPLELYSKWMFVASFF